MLGLALACVGADLYRVATVEEEHQRPFWSIGQGFEGSASDYTEYVVWLIGVIAVFYYMMSPNARRNLYEVEMDRPFEAHTGELVLEDAERGSPASEPAGGTGKSKVKHIPSETGAEIKTQTSDKAKGKGKGKAKRTSKVD